MSNIDLRAERLNRGLTLRGAAAKMGIDFKALQRAEKNIGQPTPGNAYKIASFYEYKVTDVWPLEAENGRAA